MEKRNKLQPELWVKNYGDYLYRFALARVRNEEVALDLVQEALLNAYESRHTFTGLSTERTWLTSILKYKIFDYFRKLARDKTTESIEAFSSRLGNVFDDNGRWRVEQLSDYSNPEKVLSQKEFWEALDECLKALPDNHKNAFILREIDQIKSEEICNILGISSTNLWVMLHRARLGLRICLKNKGY